jgi:integrase
MPHTKYALLICLATCCRIGEISKALWEDVDLNVRIWTINDSKNGHPLQVHLSDFALNLFEKLRECTGYSTWCIPNRENTNRINSKSISKQVGDRQVDEGKQPLRGRTQSIDALKLSGGKWTPHDLRRTGATIMVSLGVLPDVVDRCLNHQEQNKIKRTYLRHDYRIEMQTAWNKLGHKLSSHFNLDRIDDNWG